MHLREQVRDDDINVAIRVLLETFISAQKLSVARTMRNSFQKYITYKKDFNQLLFHVSNARMRTHARTFAHMHTQAARIHVRPGKKNSLVKKNE
jgi:DNA replication licensing factor MCM2